MESQEDRTFRIYQMLNVLEIQGVKEIEFVDGRGVSSRRYQDSNETWEFDLQFECCKTFMSQGENVKGSQLLCFDCPLGKYAAERSTDCLNCPAGTFNDEKKSGVCLLCEPGKYSLEGSMKCSECPLGKHSENNGAEECETCPNGSYTNSSGSTECLT
eukprot:UN02778